MLAKGKVKKVRIKASVGRNLSVSADRVITPTNNANSLAAEDRDSRALCIDNALYMQNLPSVSHAMT